MPGKFKRFMRSANRHPEAAVPPWPAGMPDPDVVAGACPGSFSGRRSLVPRPISEGPCPFIAYLTRSTASDLWRISSCVDVALP